MTAEQLDPGSDARRLTALWGVALVVAAVVALGLGGLDTSGILSGSLRAGFGVQGAVFALAAIGVNLNYGYTGLLNFGPVAFLAAGSYGMGITITNGGPFLLGILVGVLAAAFLALLLGLPTLRLRGDFLAITTIAAGEVLRVAFRSDNFFSMAIILLLIVGLAGLLTYVLPRVGGRPAQWAVALGSIGVIGVLSSVIWRAELLAGETGGPFGVPRPGEPDIVGTFYNWNPFGTGDYALTDLAIFGDILGAIPWVGDVFEKTSFNDRQLWVITVTWSLVILASLFVWRLVNSPWGRVLKAIREDEDAARAVGKNAFSYKLQSFVVGGIIAAFAGMARAMDQAFFNPESFRTQTTFFIWTVLILGGAASIRGPIAGAIVFWFSVLFIEGALKQMVERDWIPDWLLDSNNVSSVRFVFLGITLAGLMIWRPQGMFGKKEEALLDAA
ncbi:MAG: branched-chain amino acid ABC transporter permease [Actinomycetota bacterium]|jgi:neutral amino acid transport system permease protein|nr:branched-chain amino acid ABC transporter permease [Actinomycetota bacterium]